MLKSSSLQNLSCGFTGRLSVAPNILPRHRRSPIARYRLFAIHSGRVHGFLAASFSILLAWLLQTRFGSEEQIDDQWQMIRSHSCDCVLRHASLVNFEMRRDENM